jgi:Uma2 family endonuclease
MSHAVRQPRMSRAEFFDWAETQDERYEFDGFAPVAMTGGTLTHSIIMLNAQAALRARLKGFCRSFGPDAGVRTVGETVRYADAVVSCSPFDGGAYEVPNPIVVFEVLSPSSGHADRIVKLLEYRAVASLRRYVIVEYASIGATVHARDVAGAEWTTTAVAGDGGLLLPEIGIEIPLAELYAGTALAAAEG